jgi:hypothetical protein
MIENLPHWIETLFLLTFVATVVLFYVSNSKPKKLLFFIIIWSILHSVLAYNGFYKITNTMPPRFALILLPTILLIIYGLFPKQMDWVVKNRNTTLSTFLHTVRIPVEIVLLYLFLNKMIPELMTFEGRNFDILVGISAPIIGFLVLKNKISKKVLLLFNVIGLCFVLFILINALLSAETPLQQFGFEQPNKAVFHFPFILLPAVIVPLVIYTHLSDVFKLKRELRNS